MGNCLIFCSARKSQGKGSRSTRNFQESQNLDSRLLFQKNWRKFALEFDNLAQLWFFGQNQ